jgi:hypothetical protein
MPVFEFVLILVLITTIGKVIMAVGAPMVDKLGDLVREMVAARREGSAPVELSGDVLDELERRLGRIEDRLDFLEELKAPEKRRSLGSGDL